MNNEIALKITSLLAEKLSATGIELKYYSGYERLTHDEPFRESMPYRKGLVMKLPLLNISDQQAKAELKTFLLISSITFLLSLFAFGFLAIASLASGARSLILSFHPANKRNPKNILLRLASIALIALSTLGLLLVFSD